MRVPPYLKKGDTIAIVAPAKFIEAKHITFAKLFWEEKGFKVILGSNLLAQENYFAGTALQRFDDLTAALQNDEVKAIICARGGYGCLHLVDSINWAGMLNVPKWMVGFSDITVFHQKINSLGTASLHATMPLNYATNSKESLQQMVAQLMGKTATYKWKTKTYLPGKARGVVLGGNLSIVHNLIGTNDQPNYTDSILFLEEVGEHLYAIDRMFYALKKAGILTKIKGLIIGDFSELKDTDPIFGKTLEDIILGHLAYIKIPVAFGFSAGHLPHNLPLVLGKQSCLEVSQKGDCSIS